VLSCASRREPRAWPDSAVRGVQLLAEVFASMRARRLAEKREQAAVMDAAQWRERLAHLVRVHTVGEMSAALAHEINQPLMAIANYAIAARRRADALPQSDKVAELIDKVIVQTTRAGDVVARLRGMVKRNEIQARAVDFALLVDGCLDMVRMECELRDIRLQRRVASPLPPLVADGIQLQQVVLNLLRNAIEAMELAPPEAPREIGIEVAAVDGRELRVSVTDRGPGIGEADLERVFEAFYSTKVSGLGIGLSLCRKLIEAHGGTLAARDRPDGGAEFTFTLPAGDGH
jgi:signal transduction histidine kinase